MTKKLLFAGVLALTAMGAARAADLDVIALRQTTMDLVAADFAGIRAVVEAKGDVTKLQGPAKAMARWATQYPSLFPTGSDKGGNTKALPEIWSDRAGFEKQAMTMAEASTKLADVAKAGDVQAVATELKAVGDACGACHRNYRAK